MTNRVAIFRNYAAECLALAEKTTVEAERELLMNMAASWRELAILLQAYIDEHDGEELPFSELDLPELRH
jgi:hypothetical protein